ncbi:MAG: dTDP-4-dehydrorhamnose 3,5-epimerase [Patescibacteria group bacterium]
MDFLPTKFIGAWIVQPKVFRDQRGFFTETFSQRQFTERGIDVRFVQENHSLSVERGVLRGLHYQVPPDTQAKLVRVTRGAAYDVMVDLRRGSRTYGQWQGFELSAENFSMIFIPRGFAHGFCTLQENTEFQYQVDAYYAPESERGIMWNDSTLAIRWPTATPILFEKDQQNELLAQLVSPFTY